MSSRNVVVTGIGVVTPAGIGVPAFWDALMSPGSDERVRRLREFDPRRWLSHKGARTSDIATQMAVAAADEALEDAGLLTRSVESADRRPVEVRDPGRVAVVLGTGIGGVSTLETQSDVRREKGDRFVSPFVVPMVMPNAAAAALSIRYGAQGASLTVTTACAAGTDAIAMGARLIVSGIADIVIAGGSDSSLTPTCLAGFGNMRALSGSGISRPFDQDRDGLAAAEASGVVILEAEGSAVARGRTPYMIVAGAASTSDAHHVTAPSPGGLGAERCMRQAIADAGLGPADISHVNAHGTSTALNDSAEAAAIGRVFGAHRPLVTSIKGVTGHSFGAAGAVEAVAIALTIQRALIPPTAGLVHQDPDIDLEVARQPTPWVPGAVLSNSFGFGGHNGSVVFTPARGGV
jgi:3-oxoacyl-[acyl-carrier-protein] synthase II